MAEIESQPQSSNSPEPRDMQIKPYPTVIRVIGAGGAGNNTLSRLAKINLQSRRITTIAVNTDAQDLSEAVAEQKILIGRNLTLGLGAGGDPEIGDRSAEESKDLLTEAIEGTDMLFLTCGLGGGTGTGSLPVIAKIAKNQGILTIAIVTMPFTEEGIIRWENAQFGIERLKKTVDTLIVLKNDKLVDWVPDLPLIEAFKAGDDILVNALVGLSDLVQKKGLINLDFADICMIMRDGPDAMIGIGESSTENRSEEAVKRAITHPMMESDILGAQSVLIHITGGLDMTLKEARLAVNAVSKRVDPTARIIWGTSIDRNLKQTIRVMLVVSGLRSIKDRSVEQERVSESSLPETSRRQTQTRQENGRSIFDIKETIMSTGAEMTTQAKPIKTASQSTMVFYKIFEDEAKQDLKRFDRTVHLLRKKPDDERTVLEARQSVKLLLASAKMFGFDEIAQLLTPIEEILAMAISKQIALSPHILDSLSLAMEMVVDLIENKSDGRGETGYIVDRLREIKEGKFESSLPVDKSNTTH